MLRKYITTGLLAILFLTGMTGCTPDVFRRVEVIEKQTMVVAQYDKSLLDPCQETAPPSVDTYTLANRDRKEALLMAHVSDLHLDMKRCNIDKETLRGMLDRQESAIRKFNEDEAARVKRAVEGLTKKE